MVWINDVRPWNRFLSRFLPVDEVSDPSRSPEVQLLALLAKSTAEHRLLPGPQRLRPAWLTPPLLRDLKHEAAAARQVAFHHSGKRNGPPGHAAESLLDAVDLPVWVRERSGVAVQEPSTATYPH